jgi:hypothetical protein
MDKYEALRSFLAMKPRVKYFKKMVCSELWAAICAWKKDEFAPSTRELMNLDGAEYVAMYDEHFDKTVQHELSEVVELVDNFLKAHDCDMMEYYEALVKYRKLSEPDKTTIIIRR